MQHFFNLFYFFLYYWTIGEPRGNQLDMSKNSQMLLIKIILHFNKAHPLSNKLNNGRLTLNYKIIANANDPTKNYALHYGKTFATRTKQIYIRQQTNKWTKELKSF